MEKEFVEEDVYKKVKEIMNKKNDIFTVEELEKFILIKNQVVKKYLNIKK